jgi:hypothetical protein
LSLSGSGQVDRCFAPFERRGQGGVSALSVSGTSARRFPCSPIHWIGCARKLPKLRVLRARRTLTRRREEREGGGGRESGGFLRQGSG